MKSAVRHVCKKEQEGSWGEAREGTVASERREKSIFLITVEQPSHINAIISVYSARVAIRTG